MSPPTCQSHLTSQRSTQCPFTSLRFCPPCPGGLLSHWPHMDLALRSLPRFHLRSTALLDCALCEVSGSCPLGGGGALSRIWLPLTTLQLHITHGLHLLSFTALTHSHPPLHQSHSCHQSLMALFHCMVRYGSVRYGTAQFGSVAFPPQFSTAIEWAGLFTRRYNCAASTAVTSS